MTLLVEVDEELEASVAAERIAAATRELLAALSIPVDDHLTDTPARVAQSWLHQTRGYREDPARHLAVTFAVDDPGTVVVAGIPLTTTCAHHLLPIVGTATVAYRPDPAGGRVVGLSKLSRVLDGYARRLQVQERVGQQVVSALVDKLAPLAAGVVITATHGCMTLRGVQTIASETTTWAATGQWRDGGGDWATVMDLHRQSHARGR
jgi:GTP cyclohydrolase I